jgi:hypothetical protein
VSPGPGAERREGKSSKPRELQLLGMDARLWCLGNGKFGVVGLYFKVGKEG